MRRTRFLTVFAFLFSILVANFGLLPRVFAGTLNHSTVMEYNMETSATSEVALAFTTATAGATSVTIDFNGWSGGSAGTVNTTQSVATTGCTTLTGASTALPGSISASGSGSTVTISNVTALSASTSYCAILTSTSAVTNPSTAGVYDVVMTAGSDSQTTAIDVISNDSYTISATVAPTFTMSLSSSTDSFSGNLSSTALTTTGGITATINTNAASGWLLWADDTNQGLYSTQQSHTIPTVSVGSNHTMDGSAIGTEAYALGVSSVNAGTATSDYADTGGVTGGGLSNTNFNEIASYTAPAASDTVVVKELADISAVTPAANDYSDTVTLVGAGSF